jgi:integrase
MANDNDLVFTDSTGGPLRGNNVERRHYDPLMAKAGVPRIRFHDLRQTSASIMAANGFPIKVVSEMLGHASNGMTLGDLHRQRHPECSATLPMCLAARSSRRVNIGGKTLSWGRATSYET